jgi:GT2 family glycosyltransferase
MAAAQPDISVVIPTHGRENRLAFALESLADQTLDRGRFEVIVVRGPDTSGPRAAAPEGLAVRFVAAPRLGMSAQRNAGWQAARGELIAFTDDDCRPTARWLERLLERAEGATIVEGRTDPDPDERHLLYGLARSKTEHGPNEWYPTCNIAYPRSVLERVRGFDERFRLASEDTDLGLRARGAGAKLAYVEEAQVWHSVHSRTVPQALRDARRHSELARLVGRHPRQRRELWARVFYNETHAALALLVAGLLVSRLRGRRGRHRGQIASLAAAPYLFLYARMLCRSGPVTPRRAARHAAQLPVELAVDLTQILAALRGSARHRVMVI